MTPVGTQVPLSVCASAWLPSLSQTASYLGLAPHCLQVVLARPI